MPNQANLSQLFVIPQAFDLPLDDELSERLVMMLVDRYPWDCGVLCQLLREQFVAIPPLLSEGTPMVNCHV
jgi:hypothetical protein